MPDVKIWTGSVWQSLTGPAGPTAVSADANNYSKLGTDGKVFTPTPAIPAASSTVPLADGSVGVVGTAVTFARADHVHPASGPAAATTAPLALGAAGVVGTATAYARADHVHPRPTLADLGLAASSTVPLVDGAAGVVGTSTAYARADHVHPRVTLADIGAAAATHTHTAAQVTGLATVATSGSYNDLANRPTIPTAYTLPVATAAVLGGVKQGTNITIAADGTISSTASGGGGVSADANNLATLGTDSKVLVSQDTLDARYVNTAGDWMSGPLALGSASAFTGTAPLDINASTLRLRAANTPVSQTSAGEQGTMCWDGAYLYMCIATNQWRRIAWRDWAGSVTGGTWTPLTQTGNPISSIAYNGGRFTADGGKHSVDGTTWLAGTGRPVGLNVNTRAAFGLGTWVTVTRSFTSTTPQCWTSTDGVAWTSRNMGSFGSSVAHRTQARGVAFGNGRFVAMVNSGAATTIRPQWSTNGTTWTVAANAAVGMTDAAGIVFGAGLFVAVGWSSSAGGTTATCLTSPDGAVWTARTLPFAAKWNDVSFANGRFVAIAGASNEAATSTDGINWTRVTIGGSADWECIEYGGGRWIAIASGTSSAATSVDGLNWTPLSMPSAGALTWNSLATDGNVWVATNATASIAVFQPTPQANAYFPINASRSLVVTDANATIANCSTTAAPVTVTIPLESAVPFAIGTEIRVEDQSASAMTYIKAAAGVSLQWNDRLTGTGTTGEIVGGGIGVEVALPGQLSQVTLRKVQSNFWIILY